MENPPAAAPGAPMPPTTPHVPRAPGGGVGVRRLLSPSGWALALVVATAIALLVATQNWLTLSAAGRPIPWARLLALELPVWYAWVAALPAVVALATHWPPVGPHRLRNGLVHLVAGLGLTFLNIVVVTAVRWPYQDLPEGVRYGPLVVRTFVQVFALFLLLYAGMVTTVLAWRYHLEAQARALRESQMEARLTSARLDALRAQIHPHFLFNTLHAVSALMAKDVGAARRMMSRLSELLRLTLEDEGHEVTLRQELALLDRYAEIQRIRFQDRLRIVYDVPEDALERKVPGFMLQPLVENAIHHGVARRAGEGEVRVEAEVREAERRLEVRVRDDGPGFPAEAAARRRGVGIANTEARLEQLYGEAYELLLENPPEGGALVRVRMPLS